MTDDIVILDGARTAFTEFGGSLKDWSPTMLGVVAAQAAMQRSGIDPSEIDDVVFGNVIQCTQDAAYLARHVALRAGVPEETPALTVNRLCGSGLQAMVSGAQNLLSGEATVVLAGGAESLSTAPYTVPRARWGQTMGNMPFVDTLWSALTDAYVDTPMAITAENLAARYGITRQDQDDFALRSHQRAAAAMASGRLAAEIVPIEIQTKKGTQIVSSDEHVRAVLPVGVAHDVAMHDARDAGGHHGRHRAVLGRRQLDRAPHGLGIQRIPLDAVLDDHVGVRVRVRFPLLAGDVDLVGRDRLLLLGQDRHDVHRGAARDPDEQLLHRAGAGVAGASRTATLPSV